MQTSKTLRNRFLKTVASISGVTMLVATLLIGVTPNVASASVVPSYCNTPQGCIIKNLHSHLCADIIGASIAEGAKLQQWDCISGARNQKFLFKASSTAGYYTITPVITSGRIFCLDVTGASAADGASIQQWSCIPNASNQDWFIELQAGQTNTYYIKSRVTNKTKCMDVRAASLFNGTSIIQFQCLQDVNHDNQRWQLFAAS